MMIKSRFRRMLTHAERMLLDPQYHQEIDMEDQ